MSSGEDQVYEFEGFRLDGGKRLLFTTGGETVPLMPKAFEILLYLVKKAGTVAEKDELMEAIWPDTAVEENNLTQNISALRRALGEKHRENRFIATVPGRGYKFVADVRKGPDASALSSAVAVPPESRSIPPRAKRHWTFVIAGAALVILTAGGFYLYLDTKKIKPAGRIKSLAVLPFKPVTAENRDEALEMGMADTLITKLSGGTELTVRPLAAVRRFSSTEQDPAEAGRQLNVESVLDGGVQISGGRVRVSARLIGSYDGRQLWAEQFDEPMSDIFSVQDSISQRVASALRITLANGADRAFTNNVEAYQLFIRGRLHALRLVLPEVRKGISYYEQAIAVDPGYALAYAELSNAYRAMVLTNDLHPAQIMPKAYTAAARSVELDKGLAAGWTSLGSVEFWHRWDWQTAEQHFTRAIEIDPLNAQAHAFYAHLLSNTGRHDGALAEIRKARELDPLSLFINVIEGQILSLAGRDDESIRVLRTSIDLDPSFWLAHLFIARPYINKGMWNEATAAARRAKELTNGNAEATATLGYALGKSGKQAEAEKILQELESRGHSQFVPSYALAQVHLALGNRTEAIDHLERAFEGREVQMVFLKVEPRWDELRSEPRFAQLISQMKF